MEIGANRGNSQYSKNVNKNKTTPSSLLILSWEKNCHVDRLELQVDPIYLTNFYKKRWLRRDQGKFLKVLIQVPILIRTIPNRQSSRMKKKLRRNFPGKKSGRIARGFWSLDAGVFRSGTDIWYDTLFCDMINPQVRYVRGLTHVLFRGR